ncbi:MAG: tetratricopeptide repeat protein [Porphyromonadaceae bacterium]|nr:tetratricopeptide repeat protein [Porphyromonadaceae bacterium]
MTRDELYAYMRDPSSIAPEALPALRELVEAYPYCASYTFLYLYALARSEDLRCRSELRRLALYLPDRGRLYNMVETPGQAPACQGIVATSETRDPFSIIDSYLDEMRAAGEDLPTELTYTTSVDRDDYFACEPNVAESVEQEGFALLAERAGGTPSTFDPSASIPPRVSDEAQGEELEEALFTETLAKIYIQQGKYDRALRIIRSISLNYPKKNLYFADQIRFLERLINNKQ